MPWLYPDSADSYEKLLRAIDRKQFGAHFDPANLVNSPDRYYHNDILIREFVSRLGPHIKSCQELQRVDPDMPLMLEHFTHEEDYILAAE
jgi:hypothetical protein